MGSPYHLLLRLVANLHNSTIVLIPKHRTPCRLAPMTIFLGGGRKVPALYKEDEEAHEPCASTTRRTDAHTLIALGRSVDDITRHHKRELGPSVGLRRHRRTTIPASAIIFASSRQQLLCLRLTVTKILRPHDSQQEQMGHSASCAYYTQSAALRSTMNGENSATSFSPSG